MSLYDKECLQINGDSTWGRVSWLVSSLVGRRCTREERTYFYEILLKPESNRELDEYDVRISISNKQIFVSEASMKLYQMHKLPINSHLYFKKVCRKCRLTKSSSQSLNDTDIWETNWALKKLLGFVVSKVYTLFYFFSVVIFSNSFWALLWCSLITTPYFTTRNRDTLVFTISDVA